MPKLIVTDSGGAVTEHEIRLGSASIGRSTECEVVVLESKASRRHAVVEWDGERLLLRDEGSHNGTSVNGERIAPGPEGQAELSHGDEIRIGAAVLKVVMASGAAPGRASPRRPDDQKPRPTGGPEKASLSEEATKDEETWKIGDDEVIEDGEAPEEGAKGKEAKGKGAKGKAAKQAAKRRPSRRKAGRETADQAARNGLALQAPAGSETARTSRRKRVILGGRRLSEQQQTIVKIASFAVIVLSLIGMAWLLNRMNKPVKRGRHIVVDPRAEPERLAEEAHKFARQARAAEDTGDIREALRLISEAKDRIEEADRLYSKLAQRYEGKGRWRGQVKARQIKTQAYGIRTQHFRLDMQVRREEGRL